MKSSNLRIGNLVDLGNRIAKVTEINHLACVVVDLEETQDTIEDYERVKGIILTEEWLLKFGEWVKEDDLFVRRLDTINDALRLDYINDDGELCWEFYVYNIAGQRVGCAYIKYVHQLQNLYFALTGEELEMKL
jgi:hypothetical protein